MAVVASLKPVPYPDTGLELPAYAGWGNMQSSSTDMAISPMGIINACNPRQAVLETLDVASFIHHGGNVGYCRDADTISTMVGSIVGAPHGASGLPAAWVAKVEANPYVTYREDAEKLAQIVRQRINESQQTAAAIELLG